ncbi:extracellular solute-binding protein [Microbacterium saccharophilum]|uniref:Extracellular solute-binding protein n=1 Tax=Microbacterium saccharophilum TaxID=1213358 RepID=A0A5C8I7U3_9MICO|nr:extracellular solute-binding protein [Microbacterium saccharophilum]TXK15491.1 extracellular solute-binding protein [Microbacterium saccharophilum]GEP47218.1 ABC transporter substrate-binding protein [Microbacterium saccharophilum]
MRHLRSATTVVALVAAGALLAGCSGGGSPSASDDAVTLTFWGTYGNGGNSAQTDELENELIPAFEKENPGITVEYVDMPYDGLKQKLTTSAAGGELPDLIRSDIGWVAQFAKLGVFKQLDGTMPGFEDLADAVYPGTLETTSWNGHYYGIPLNTNTRVLVTDAATLQKAGLSAPPATFDDLEKLAAGLDGSGTFAFADSGLSAWNVMPWIWSAGGDIADADLTTSTGYLDSPESVAGVQLLVDLYQKGQIPNLITGNTGATGTSDGLPGGLYASILDGPWMQDIWAGQYPDFAPAYSPMPSGDGGSISVVGGESLVVTESTAHADAAYKFLEFSQSETFQLGMARAGQMSVKPEFAQKQADLVPYFATFSDQLETARARLPIPQAGEVDTILNDELVPAFEGKVTVADALTAAAKKIDALLADNG